MGFDEFTDTHVSTTNSHLEISVSYLSVYIHATKRIPPWFNPFNLKIKL